MKFFIFSLALLSLPSFAQADSYCGRLEQRGSGGIIAGSLHDFKPNGEHRLISVGDAQIAPKAVFPEKARACACLEGKIEENKDGAAFVSIVAVRARSEATCLAESL